MNRSDSPELNTSVRLNRSSFLLISSLILLGPILLLSAVPASADPYYNSSEPGCNGTDPNVAFCDDFEDGTWYVTDCNSWTTVGNDGWCGTIFADPITPAGAAICGAGITPFGNCAADAGTKTGIGGRNFAMRSLKTATCGTNGTQSCPVDTLYVRWYAYWTPGYLFGAEKHTNITDINGDIAFANIQLNCGAGGTSSTASPSVQVIHTSDQAGGYCRSLGVTINSGHWYFFEFRVTVSSTNTGVIQVWFNDCGAAGTSCGASPTLVYYQTGLNLPGNSNSSKITGVWFESWANPASVGTGPYLDQIKASQTGPIGFAGGAAPPSAPLNLKVQ